MFPLQLKNQQRNDVFCPVRAEVISGTVWGNQSVARVTAGREPQFREDLNAEE
jgi:hypothetical protein